MDPRIEKFCLSYLVSFNATRAAIEAGYSPAAAGQTGYKLLRREDVQAFLAEARARACDAADVDAARVVRELARIAFSDMRDLMTWGSKEVDLPGAEGVKVQMPFADPHDSSTLSPDVSAAVAEVSVGKAGFKIKLHDKLSALDKLGRHFGIFETDNKQVADGIARLIEVAQGTALPLGAKKDQTA